MRKQVTIIWILLFALLLCSCSTPAPVRRANRLVQGWAAQEQRRCDTQYRASVRVYCVRVYCAGGNGGQAELRRLLRHCFSGSGITVELLVLPQAEAKK